MSRIQNEEKVNDNKLNNKQNSEKLTRIPVNCPLTNCQQVMGSAEIMAHYLRDHGSHEFEFREVKSDQKLIMIMDLDHLKFGVNSCLGMLVYDDPMCLSDCNRPNSFLPEGYERFCMHLPVLIMVCKTSITSFIKDEQYRAKVTDPSFLDQHIYVIWLVTVMSNTPIHGTITLFDRNLKISRSRIMKCRQLNEPQMPEQFIGHDLNYLLLRYGEIRKLTHNGKNCVNLEVLLQVYET